MTSDLKLLSGDNLKKHANKWNNKNKSIKLNQFSSVDAIAYSYKNNELKLLFIEFKHISNEDKYQLKKVVKRYKKELKLKSFETLNCVIPHLIDKFCEKKHYIDKEKELISFLYTRPKTYICVIKDSSQNNLFSQHLNENEDIFDLAKLSKHPFDHVKTMSPVEFKEFINQKFETIYDH